MLLYDSPVSGNCYKVRLLLAQLGIPYERRTMDVVDRSNRREVLGELNPALRVPTLVLDDGRALGESGAILWYFGEGTRFVPDDRYDRAQVLQWMFFEQYDHEPAIAVARFWLAYSGRPEEFADRLPERIAAGERALARWSGTSTTDSSSSVTASRSPTSRSTRTRTLRTRVGSTSSPTPRFARGSQRVAAEPDHVPIDRMKIRAAVLEEFGAPLTVQELDLAEPKAGEVLVRLVACGVCHTDLYTASGADPSGYSPTVLGHEGAGVVERVGEGVTDVAPGDHVVTLFSPQCRDCEHCRDHRTNLCLAIREQQNQGYLPDGTARLSRDGEPIRHFMGTSTFAEYTVMPEIALAKIDSDAPLDRACLFACGLSTGIGAAMNTAKVAPGSTCVVFGAGMVGLGAVAGCRLQGAERIVCVDLSEDRLALARGQGATDTFVGGPDAVQQIVDMTDGFGADYTFEATGNVNVMRQAVESARMGWGLATMCGVAGKGETLDVIPRFLITGRRVAGSSFGGVKGRDQVPQFVDMYLAGDIDVDAFVSHKLTLDDVNRGFELMEAQDGIRSVIDFD